MLAPRSNLAAAAVDNIIYAIGGNNGTEVGTVDEYDPSTDSWTSKADMPTPRVNHAAAAVNGKIYVFGGEAAGSDLASVEEFDPATNTWTTKSPMPTARRNAAAAVVGNVIYVVGGCSVSCYYDGTGALATVERYDPATDTWLTSAPMPTARWALAAATLNGRIYAIGGLGNQGVHFTTVEEYDPTTDSWSGGSPMSTPRQGHTANTVAGRIYVVGGHDGVSPDSYVGAVDEYTPTSTPTPVPYGWVGGIAEPPDVAGPYPQSSGSDGSRVPVPAEVAAALAVAFAALGVGGWCARRRKQR